MTRPCAWCGADVPAKRRGRKGTRAFCPGLACKDAFAAAVWRIGSAYLAAAQHPETGEKRFLQWVSNSSDSGIEGHRQRAEAV